MEVMDKTIILVCPDPTGIRKELIIPNWLVNRMQRNLLFLIPNVTPFVYINIKMDA